MNPKWNFQIYKLKLSGPKPIHRGCLRCVQTLNFRITVTELSLHMMAFKILMKTNSLHKKHKCLVFHRLAAEVTRFVLYGILLYNEAWVRFLQ